MKNWRVNIVFLFVVLAFSLVLVKLFSVQILKGGFYSALAQGQQNFFEEVSGERGEIFAQNSKGEMIPLAINHSWYFVFVSPKEIENKEISAELLSIILNIPKEELLNSFNKESTYQELKERLTNEEVDAIGKLNMKGIYISKKNGRFYPNNTLASKLLGFVDTNKEGNYGLEERYDKSLKGEEGLIKGKKTANGIFLSEEKNRIDKGSNLLLTIDYNIQAEAEKILQGSVEELNAESGQIVVMDPKTGKILALADFPNFNPNEYDQYAKDLSVFQNSVTEKLFEPGSIFKPLTMSAAINDGKITPETTYIDKGIIQIGGWKIYNYGQRSYGEQTMTNVLEKSINTGAVFAMQATGQESFLDYIEKFGLFESSGIDIPETYSNNTELKNGREINFATASYGQGIGVTPIQMIKAFSAVANKGKMVTPFIVEKSFKDSVLETSKVQEKQVISKETAETITNILVSVIENGYSKKAIINGYWIAGKTGTAQVSNSALGINKSGYSDKTIQSFLGFAPAYNPKFLILIKLDNPEAKTAEYSAIPAFRRMAKYIIDYYQIPPDHEE